MNDSRPPSHIRLDETGRAWIGDTGVKVREVVCDVVEAEMTPQQIHEAYPYLSLAQIHAALSYYYDHQAAFDREIEEGQRLYEKMRAEALPFQVGKEELLRRWRERESRGR